MDFDIRKMLGLTEEDEAELPPIPLRPDYQLAMTDAPEPKMNPMVMESLSNKYPESKIQLPESAPAEIAAIPKEDSLNDKYKKDFGDEAYKKSQADAEEGKSGLGWLQFGAGIGDAIAGRSSSETAKNFDNIRKGIDEKTVGAFAKRKDQATKDIATKKTLDESDPSSNSSKAFRKMMEANFPKIAAQYGEGWANVTAADQDNIFKPLQLRETIEARKEAARALGGQREDARRDRKDALEARAEEKMQGLKTPFGIANTEDDAKKLKEAHESKQNFDNKIKEMIALREKHGGGDAFNREDVARGKQLSKDLLLEYKNMAKLGVLSASDEKIINAIIPEDPLAYNSPMAAMQGQDPILSNLKKFAGDSDRDFSTRVATRTREGIRTGGDRVIGTSNQEHNEAVKWAMQNPGDPRAAKILSVNGTKIGGR